MDRLLSRRGFILGASALAALPLMGGCAAQRDAAEEGSAPSKGSLAGGEIEALADEASSPCPTPCRVPCVGFAPTSD